MTFLHGLKVKSKKISKFIKFMSFSLVFGGFSMKNFAQVMGLLYGSAGAHTYPKSGQVAPPPPPSIIPSQQRSVHSICFGGTHRRIKLQFQIFHASTKLKLPNVVISTKRFILTLFRPGFLPFKGLGGGGIQKNFQKSSFER